MHQIEKIRKLIKALSSVRERIMQKEIEYRGILQDLPFAHMDSARNLIRYLALRTFNLREVQSELSNRGLSSVGHSERYTLANIDNILHLLHLLVGE